MAPPPIQLFLTTIASQITLRQRQEYILRILQVKKIPFTSYDLASDEDAKRLWRRKAPRDKQQLPGILVGGEFPGTFEQFEEAVEFDELSTFLRLTEDYTPFSDDAPLLHASPIGVPGAYSPLQMHPQHAVHSRSPSPSPLAVREKEREREQREVVKGEGVLDEFGLGDVRVSVDELEALVGELGLGGEEARELVSGLAGTGVGGSRGKGEKKGGEESEKGETAPLGGTKKVEEETEEKPTVAVENEGDKPQDIPPPPKDDSETAKSSQEETDKPEKEEDKQASEPRIKITPPRKTLPVEPKATS